jgi:hypothetical protein
MNCAAHVNARTIGLLLCGLTSDFDRFVEGFAVDPAVAADLLGGSAKGPSDQALPLPSWAVASSEVGRKRHRRALARGEPRLVSR